MKLITKQNRADNVAKEWHETYYVNGKWRYCESGDKLEVYRKIIMLRDNPDPDKIDAIIGNTSWTELQCDECDELVDKVVRVGGDIDNGSASADLCFDCIKKLCDITKE